jgi:hypothetical protein
MASFRFALNASSALAAAVLLSACAYESIPLTSGAFTTQAERPAVAPPSCKGQKDAKQYASLTVTLSTKGGSFCIPAFGGFGGTVEYPSADPSVKLKLISSTTDYNHQPQLGSGTAIFYMQLALSSGTDFGDDAKAGGGLAGKAIVAKKPYTIYGQATVLGFKFDFGPCYVVATKSKYGGAIGGVGTLLEGEDIPSKATGIIEIYSGQQTSKQCQATALGRMTPPSSSGS